MMARISIDVHEFEKKKTRFMVDIFVCSAATLSFIFQSAFLYGYSLLLFKESRQHKIYMSYSAIASYSLCPVFPILEIYLHGVAVTSILAFLTVLILTITSLSPPSGNMNSTQDAVNPIFKKRNENIRGKILDIIR
jgi:hypothetical protein